MQKIVFENTTVYGAETVNALSELVGRIVRKQTHFLRKTAMIAAAILCCGVGIICLAASTQQMLGICLILIGVLAGAKGILFKKLKVWGGAPAADGEVRSFAFLEEGIQMTRSNGIQKGCLYSDIMLHSKTEESFLLMQNFQTGFLLRKDGFTKGSIDDFRAFLVKKTFCRQFEIAIEPKN